MAVSGSYCYVATDTFGLQIVNVSNPYGPTFVSSFLGNSRAYHIAISANVLYLADYYAGVYVLDISNPASPSLTGRYDTPGRDWGIDVSGQYMYTADWYSWMALRYTGSAPQFGAVGGTVTEQGNGNPLSNVIVELLLEGTPVASDTTAAEGQYLVQNLTPDTYQVLASKSGYVPDTISGVAVLANDTTVQNIVLAPIAGPIGAISGTVTRQDNGTPLADAMVRAMQAGFVIASDTTDAGGLYNISFLAPGSYDVIGTKIMFVPDTVFGVIVVQDNTTTANLVLASVPFIPGDANGSGDVNGVDVSYMVNYLKGFGPPPPDPILRADANGNCQVNGVDVVYLVNYLKGIGPAPVMGNCKLE